MRRAREDRPARGLALGDVEVPEAPPRKGLPYSMYLEAMKELEGRRILFDLTPPDDELEALPANLSDQGPAVIMKHYQNTLRWWQHVSTVDADVDARMVEAQANLENIKARCEEQKIEPELYEEFIEWKRKVVKYKIMQKMLEPKKSRLSRQMAMVSRSVEGLKTEWQSTVRGGNLGRRSGGGYGGQLPPL